MPHEIPILSVVAILVLGFLHWIGMRELARLALVLGLATLVVEGTLVAAVVVQLQPSDWADLWGNFGHLEQLSWSSTRQPASPAPGCRIRGWSRWASSRPRCASRAAR